MTFFFCKERVADETEKNKEEGKKAPSTLKALKALVFNKYWVLVVIVMFSIYFMMSVFFGSNYYFTEYVLENSGVYSQLLNILSMSQLAIMFVTPFIMRKMPKRWLAIAGMALSMSGFILTAFAGKNITLLLVSNVIKGIGFGCGSATMWGMLQDAITYGQWRSGVQAIGLGNSASAFAMKVGSGLGSATLGWILAAGNFNADPTGAASITAINIAVIWIPIIVSVINIVCLLFFDLDKNYGNAVKDLENRKWKDGTF